MPLRVVVIDDSDWMRQMVRHAASTYPEIEVVGEGADAAEGIVVCREAQPDVILLDVQMPGMSGTEALPFLRDVVPGARIVMFTADPARDAEAGRLGVDDWIVKSSVSLPEMIRRLAGRDGDDRL
jgi:DNA-binding NarL/FixJ family response regulator